MADADSALFERALTCLVAGVERCVNYLVHIFCQLLCSGMQFVEVKESVFLVDKRRQNKRPETADSDVVFICVLNNFRAVSRQNPVEDSHVSDWLVEAKRVLVLGPLGDALHAHKRFSLGFLMMIIMKLQN